MADPEQFARRLARLDTGIPRSALDEFLAARIPIHFGGMSDPFTPLELSRRRTLEFLRILAEHKYPTLISTKGDLIQRNEYVELLREPNFAVQISLSCLFDQEAIRVDAGAPNTSNRLRIIAELSRAGVKVAIRLQPLFPTREHQAAELISRAADAGARHVSVEFLKLPIEQGWEHRSRLSAALGIDFGELYRSRGATRQGREWILPVVDRLPTILSLRDEAHAVGMSFGAGDNDLLHLSDGTVCCSGADLLGVGNGYRHTFLAAVVDGFTEGAISISSISDNWRPTRSISRYLNSHSRNGGTTAEAYIRSRWNGVANGPSPLSFFGVSSADSFDAQGLRIYRLTKEVQRLRHSAILAPASVD